MRKWSVNTKRLISLLSKRLYSNVLYSGIKELIVNSLDARRKSHVRIQIWIGKKYLIYKDDGTGINPKQFNKLFGEIASDHERVEGARGFFGIGRLGLLSQSTEGKISTYWKNNIYEWKFNLEGYEGPKKLSKRFGHGITLEFRGLDTDVDIKDLAIYLGKILSIPLLRNECSIDVNQISLVSFINPSFQFLELDIAGGKIDIWYREDKDGLLIFSHRGIGVMEESYTGITAFIDDDFLKIKTDREGFINDKVYQDFRKVVRNKLSSLRPQKVFQEMEAQFIKRLMKEFKKYWITRKKKTEVKQIQETETATSIESLEEPVETVELDFQTPDEMIIKPELNKEPEIEISGEQDSNEEDSFPELIPEIVDPNSEPLQPESGTLPPSNVVQESKKEMEKEDIAKTVIIKGAKPMDLGADQPMIYFEREPFVFIFNTSHPTFQKLVERGTLSSDKLAVLFERMFECAYEDKYPSEDADSLRKRWSDVDKKLEKVFK